jgi:hypothetical protein
MPNRLYIFGYFLLNSRYFLCGALIHLNRPQINFFLRFVMFLYRQKFANKEGVRLLSHMFIIPFRSHRNILPLDPTFMTIIILCIHHYYIWREISSGQDDDFADILRHSKALYLIWRATCNIQVIVKVSCNRKLLKKACLLIFTQ